MPDRSIMVFRSFMSDLHRVGSRSLHEGSSMHAYDVVSLPLKSTSVATPHTGSKGSSHSIPSSKAATHAALEQTSP